MDRFKMRNKFNPVTSYTHPVYSKTEREQNKFVFIGNCLPSLQYRIETKTKLHL